MEAQKNTHKSEKHTSWLQLNLPWNAEIRENKFAGNIHQNLGLNTHFKYSLFDQSAL